MTRTQRRILWAGALLLLLLWLFPPWVHKAPARLQVGVRHPIGFHFLFDTRQGESPSALRLGVTFSIAWGQLVLLSLVITGATAASVVALAPKERIATCWSCGRKNRLSPKQTDGKYRCGACQAVLTHRITRMWHATEAWCRAHARTALIISCCGFFVTLFFMEHNIKAEREAAAAPVRVAPTSGLISSSHEQASPVSFSPVSTTSAPSASERNATVPLVNNQVLFDSNPSSNTENTLTVSNGTSHGAIAKLIHIGTGRKLLSFSVGARDQAGVIGIPSGSYRLIFAFGDRLYAGSDRLEEPQGFSEFSDTLCFAQRQIAEGIEYSELSVTLHSVANGNAKTDSISQAQFEAY